MTPESRQAALEAAGLAHPSPEAVTAPLFSTGTPFFFRLDKIQGVQLFWSDFVGAVGWS